jgi:hypothetical protein
MAKANKVTTELAARVAHWRGYGLGRDAISRKLKAEGFDLSPRGVSRVLAKGASVMRRGAAVAATISQKFARGADGDDELGQLRTWAREVRAVAAELLPRSKEGGRNASIFCQLVRLETDLARAIRDLTPPPKPDPAIDPANVEARHLLIATIESLVSEETQP